MAISDTERREVACRLRADWAMFRCRGTERVPLFTMRCMDQLLREIGLNPERTDWHTIALRLADLIDRPTCTVESKGEMNPWEEYEMKLSCGDAVVWPADQSLPRYCPWCGARVVSGNE